MFGMDPEQGERVYVPQFDLDVEPGQIVLFSGTSGTERPRAFASSRRRPAPPTLTT